MKRVHITLHNIQSHEYTEFNLVPGLNFILADGNNVGKSTIFRVLQAIAKAPYTSIPKLRALLREKCANGFAKFEFDDEIVTVLIARTEGAPKMIFSHSTGDGTTTRGVNCPQSLLDALGIYKDRNNNVININDADSVKIISKMSVESDEIIASVMIDQDLEVIKSNLLRLDKESASDFNTLSGQAKSAQEVLDTVGLNSAVDDFFENLQTMQSGARIADLLCSVLPSEVKPLPDIETCVLDAGFSALTAIHDFLCAMMSDERQTSVPREAQAIYSVLNLLQDIDIELVKDVRCLRINVQGLTVLRNVVTIMQGVSYTANTLRRINQNYAKLRSEFTEISKVLADNVRLVDCPIKGKVFYSSEQCIPYSF